MDGVLLESGFWTPSFRFRQRCININYTTIHSGSYAQGDRKEEHTDIIPSDRSSTHDGGDNEWKAFDAAFRGKTTPARFQRSDGGFHGDGKGQLKSGKSTSNGEEEEKLAGWSTESSRGGRGLLPLDMTTNRWVDFCSGDSSSSSSTDDMHLLVPGRNTRSGLLTDRARKCAPGFDGGGNGGSYGPVPSAGQRFCSLKNNNDEQQNRNRHRPEGITTAAQARGVRRLPLSVYTDATAFPSTQQQQQQQQQNERFNDRMFGGFLLLHACLCEAPLAVVEGLLRGPLYLAAAAWVAIVALVGASGHAEQRAELSRHAAALAREGILLLCASLTLAVPFSTTCTVYGEVADRGDDDWDVGPVPTLLGAVDPLRFFVFAFGQAGEFAANGRPEPLHQTDSPHLSRSAFTSSPGSRDVWADSGRFDSDSSTNDTRIGSLRSSPAASRFGGIAAESMDTDRLGVGMLHPPQEVGLSFRRGGGSAKRAAVSAYRRLRVSAATVYRRLATSDSAVLASAPKSQMESSGGAGVGTCALV